VEEAETMSVRTARWVLLTLATALLLGACARPKPERQVLVPTIPDAEAAAVTIVVETPTDAPIVEEAAAPTETSETEATEEAEPTLVAEPTNEPTLPPATATEVPSPTALPTEVPTAAPTPTAEPETFTYRVQQGDTLGSIAARFGTTSREIAALNNLPSSYVIKLGQNLRIPGTGPEPVDAIGTITYRVRSGETLSLIALRHRTSTAAILQANASIGSPQQLQAGALITVPIGTEGPVVAHTVAAGETLASIADDYGVSAQSILSMNALTDASQVEDGQVLYIPQ
jgi:LysM repeat protein